MSYHKCLMHIVFGTYSRKATLPAESRESLYKYINSIIVSLKGKLIRIGGIEDHVHILVDASPTVTITHLIGEIKRQSSMWMKGKPEFPDFEGWSKEYFVASWSAHEVDVLCRYIENQVEHHKHRSTNDEFKAMFEDSKLMWSDDYKILM